MPVRKTNMQRSLILASSPVFIALSLRCADDPVTSTSVSGLLVATETPSTVSRPLLRQTLPASWDENWFSSPAVYDLDQDGESEIIASRHSVLYVWSAGGTLLWRAPVGENASTGNDHGSHRMYCSPTVADVDGDGIVEIVVSLKDALGGGMGGVQVWDVPSAVKNRMDWPTGRGNYLRTGRPIF